MSIAQSASFSGENWVAGGVGTGTGTLDAAVVSAFVRDSNGAVSVKTTTYTLDGFTAGSMNLLFGGDATGAISATTGILGTIASSWTTVDFDTAVAGTTPPARRSVPCLSTRSTSPA